MTENHPRDGLAAYALGAVEPAERAEIERHLAECERCRADLRWLEPAVAVLPASVPQHEPPRGLRRKLLRAVRDEARAERGGWWARRPGWITLRARPAVVVGAMALLGAGIAGYAVNEAGRPSQPTVTEVRAEGTGDAAAVLTRSEDEAVLRVEHLPALGPNRVYQLWVREGDVMHPHPTFVVDAKNRATAPLGSIPPGAEEVLVTREPAGGSERPSSRPLLTAPLG
jgi:anti-sigma-K factor RskA